MKGAKTGIIILGIIVLGFIGYYFYTSLQSLENEQDEYQFTAGEEIMNDDYNQNEEYQAETQLETEIENQENQELQAEAEFNELEAMDF
tara:strand:- start:1437 stop:1703 length:267 start_codon:yes stop_codon:yes gene_type:complete